MFNKRSTIRQKFIDAWKKRDKPESLTALEQQIVSIVTQHPEYHAILEGDEDILDKDYRTDNNPFLHLSLHLGIHEQLTTNRPQGIREIYEKLCEKYQDTHQVEHLIAEAMANSLWEAQQQGKYPDENAYLEKLKQLIK